AQHRPGARSARRRRWPCHGTADRPPIAGRASRQPCREALPARVSLGEGHPLPKRPLVSPMKECIMSRFCVVRWLQMIEHRFRRATRKRQARAGLRQPRFVPRLEALEDRVVPSTLTVTNNTDSGAGSLRAQIAAANPGDTIDFAPYVHSITLTGGQLVIAKD